MMGDPGVPESSLQIQVERIAEGGLVTGQSGDRARPWPDPAARRRVLPAPVPKARASSARIPRCATVFASAAFASGPTGRPAGSNLSAIFGAAKPAQIGGAPVNAQLRTKITCKPEVQGNFLSSTAI
jgi:hypothetical protein